MRRRRLQTLLCFDPTRGIESAQHQIYRLLREIADTGASVLLFTSELPEISLVCDRAIVLFGGEIVAEMPAGEADESALLRAAHGLSVVRRASEAPGRDMGSRHQAINATAMRASALSNDIQRPNAGLGVIDKINSVLAGHRALIGMPALLVAFLAATVAIHPGFDSFDAQSIAIAALPSAFTAAAQAVVVISGGIDLSIGSVMAVANVLAASTMRNACFAEALFLAIAVLVAGAAIGAVNGLMVIVSRVPDAIVLTGFIWGGVALLILEKPGGGAPRNSSISARARS